MGDNLNSNPDRRPIMLWSVPRSTSTAFERAFIQRKDTEVFHEPFAEPHYFGPERLCHRYTAEQCSSSPSKDTTFSDVLNQLLKAQAENGDKFIIAKDMAQYIIRAEKLTSNPRINPTVLSDDELRKFRHTFLVRTPQKSISSYYRATLGGGGRNFGQFEPEEAGFVELKALLDYTKRLLPEDSVVLIDSADLVAQPERTLRAFCFAVGIPFDTTMLSWEAGSVSKFEAWKGWHDDAENSTGFKEIKHDDKLTLPESIKECIEKNMPIYEELRDYKIQI